MEIRHTNTTFTLGLPKLDKRFWKPEIRELIILFGYMSAGKTEFSYFLARKNAEKNKVWFINLELPEYDMKLRIARKRAGITKYNYQTHNYSEEQNQIMLDEWDKINKIENIIIDCPDDKSLIWIEKSLRTLYDIGCRFFIIDNLDKIPADRWDDENRRYQKITSFLQDFKNNNGVCIFLIHHAKKPDSKWVVYKRAGMAGMRWSQKIMDNATQVFEIRRDLDPDCEPEDRNKVEIIQMKDTFEGANGTVEIYFHKWEYHEENHKDLPF